MSKIIRKKALIIYTNRSTFVEGDMKILGREYELIEYGFVNYPKNRLPLSLIRQFFYLLFNLRRFDLVYIWFADYHSWLPIRMASLFGVRAYLVIGGYDVCREKKYGYGSFVKKTRGFMARQSMEYATLNLCVSHYIERVVRAIAPKTKTEVIYNGVDIATFKRGSEGSGGPERIENSGEYADRLAGEKEIPAKDKMILCVAIINSSQTYYIKGIDRYIALAESFPENKFLLVGADRRVLERECVREQGKEYVGGAGKEYVRGAERGSAKELPENLVVMPKIRHQDLGRLYCEAHVYCQLSRRESFSLSLAEAMLYEAAPVVTNVGGMPEVTGDLGVIVDGNVSEEIIAGLKNALERGPCPECAERVINEFSIEKRAEKVLSTISFHSKLF